MRCQLCTREAAVSEEGLCRYHTEAYRRLKEGFERWRHAYGEIEWIAYVKMVGEKQETGIWVRECCMKILGEEPLKSHHSSVYRGQTGEESSAASLDTV